MLARDLIKESLELRGRHRSRSFCGEKGEKSFDPAGALTHEQVWE